MKTTKTTLSVPRKVMLACLSVATAIGVIAAGSAIAANPAEAAKAKITKAEAKKIALADANVAAKNATFEKITIDTEKGVKVYEVDFRVGKYDYDYDIAIKGGKIIDKDKELIKSAKAKKASKSKYPISKAKAKKIALAHAGFTKAQVKGLKASIDYEDGVKVWEVEFDKGKWEYEYDINMKTGKIVDWDKDRRK